MEWRPKSQSVPQGVTEPAVRQRIEQQYRVEEPTVFEPMVEKFNVQHEQVTTPPLRRGSSNEGDSLYSSLVAVISLLKLMHYQMHLRIGLQWRASRYHGKEDIVRTFLDSSEGDSFLGSLSAMPVRLATSLFKKQPVMNFTQKLRQVGSKTVNKGNLRDGTSACCQETRRI
ncbi:G-type lectin S-receptor-like serine/threonine-protein kinase SD2-5 [Bienertia sinuspersici]